MLLTLDLSYNALGDAAGIGVARALRTNHTLRLLDLSRNRLGAPSAAAWAGAVAAGRHLATLKLGWNRLGTAGALDIIAACAKAPPVGRTVAPSPLHTLRLENCCGAGHEHALLEAVHTVVAFLSRLNRSAPSIVVEFPDRHRTVVRETSSRSSPARGRGSGATTRRGSRARATGARRGGGPSAACSRSPPTPSRTRSSRRRRPRTSTAAGP